VPAAGMMVRTLALTCALVLVAEMALAQCRALSHEGLSYTVCEAEAGPSDIRLWLRAPDGEVFGTFERLADHLADRGEQLSFAMNAGMYHSDRRPVGLYVEEGEQQARIVTSQGPGNFGLLPNGVFCVGATGFAVVESRRFAEGGESCIHATQSGPMLVIDGALHPRFLPQSTSRYLRNGVGVSADGQRAVFAISDERVNFDEFARMFRDALGLRDALYFDGNVSRLHAPALGRSDGGRPMGPIIGMVAPAD